MKLQETIIPEPRQIFEHLNGDIIGHYVMKKALSVSIYNHLSIKRDHRSQSSPPSSTLSECRKKTAATQCNRPGGSAWKKRPNNASEDDVPNTQLSVKVSDPNINREEFLTPIVARVIIEASTHRIHLQKSNVLTFDSTGSSKPLLAIATKVAEFLSIPFVKCDCSMLSQEQTAKTHGQRRTSLPHGTLNNLLRDFQGVTVRDVMANLLKSAQFNVGKAETGMVFLDKMDSIGSGACGDLKANLAVKEEILDLIKGTSIKVPVAEAAGSGDDYLSVDTSNIFFVCFGVSGELTEDKHNGLTKPEAAKDIAAPLSQLKGTKTETAADTKSMSSGVSSQGSSGQKNPKTDDQQHPQTLKHLRGGGDAVAARAEEVSDEEGYDEEDFEYYDYDEFMSTLEEEDRQVSELMEEARSKPIPKCLSRWGMEDVELKFGPGALELITHQAMGQQAGSRGIENILEKIIMNIKFDILGTNTTAVEITEESVLGKKSPVYFHSHGICNQRRVSNHMKPFASSSLSQVPCEGNKGHLRNAQGHSNTPFMRRDERSKSLPDPFSAAHPQMGNNNNNPFRPLNRRNMEDTEDEGYETRLTEFDLEVLDSLEI